MTDVIDEVRPLTTADGLPALGAEAVRVLLVEDNAGDAELLVEMLTGGTLAPGRPTTQVVWVERLSSAESMIADAAAQSTPFDAVLLDLSLPDARGLEAVHALQTNTPDIPVVVVTGLADDMMALAAVHAGAQDYLVKGQSDGRVVRRAVRYAMERQALARERDALLARERAAREAAQRAAHLRDEVLSIVSHDLRTPLSTIAVCGQALLAAPDLSAESRELYETILQSARWANRIIGDLLDVASIERGRLSLHCEPVEPRRIAAELEAMFAPLAAERSVSLTVSAAPGLPNITVDPERVVQAVGNLLSNAIKFTPRGGDVRLAVTAGAARVLFAVRDTGRGIEPEHLPHLFDRFWQARTSRRGGAGLGLAIARGIADLHGGSLDVVSELGKGSTFTFATPVVRDA
jgi:signal transduction histidine kinase